MPDSPVDDEQVRVTMHARQQYTHAARASRRLGVPRGRAAVNSYTTGRDTDLPSALIRLFANKDIELYPFITAVPKHEADCLVRPSGDFYSCGLAINWLIQNTHREVSLTMRRALFLALAISVWASIPFAGAETTAACQNEPYIIKQLACFIDAAKAADDPTVCRAANEKSVIFNCISKYAEDTGRVEACAQIPEDIDPNSAMLRESCVAAVAVKQLDPGLCAEVEITGIRDGCYLLMVTKGGADPQICERIQAEPLQRSCRDK